jgi:hypothetical protein
MALHLNSDTENAILNFKNCFKFVLGKEIVAVNRTYFDEIELLQVKSQLLEEIAEDFESDFPSNRAEITSFFDTLHQVGFQIIDDASAKVGQRIFEFLKSGVTLQSLGSNIPPTPEELDRYASFKGKELLVYIVAEEFKIEENTDDFEKLDEYAFLISSSIVNFFRQGYNVSGPAINAAFVTGVGVLMLWALVK